MFLSWSDYSFVIRFKHSIFLSIDTDATTLYIIFYTRYGWFYHYLECSSLSIHVNVILQVKKLYPNSHPSLEFWSPFSAILVESSGAILDWCSRWANHMHSPATLSLVWKCGENRQMVTAVVVPACTLDRPWLWLWFLLHKASHPPSVFLQFRREPFGILPSRKTLELISILATKAPWMKLSISRRPSTLPLSRGDTF